MTKQPAILCSRLLPPDAVKRLQRAAKTPTEGNPLARVKAIEDATFWAKLKFPHLFRQE